jgi:hypothetical protein
MIECNDSQQEFLPTLFRDYLNPEGVGREFIDSLKEYF